MMRSVPFDRSPTGLSSRLDEVPLDLTGGLPPPDDYDFDEPDDRDEWLDDIDDLAPLLTNRRWAWFVRIIAAFIVLLVVVVGWLFFTAPLSKSLEPPTSPSITLLAANGTPIARRGSTIGRPVDAGKLPSHVTDAFLAIEDRRFYSHWGIDPVGIIRAMAHNVAAGSWREGGSTITQQLAKNAFLDSDRTAGRKIREALIALWLEAWLTKNEILSRYLSNVYFGDNVYGLRAAAKHYFSTNPEGLTIGQAAMLAGLVKAPSRLAPTDNLVGARARQAVVVAAMVRGGFLSSARATSVVPARLRPDQVAALPDGTYFADWVLPAARDQAGAITTEPRVKTTLDVRLQRAAERAVRRAGLRTAQVALVAMRPDGRIVAMVGGKSYAASPFNRATQARRQPGSAFKLFVYLAALRSGLTPDSEVEDSPVTIGNWSPKNNEGRYRGTISLREAFARSSNVAAARLTQKVGVREVIRAARDLGISTPLPEEATIALGTANVSLLELTAAYASFAAGSYPVRPRGLDQAEKRGWLDVVRDPTRPIGGQMNDHMHDLLAASIAGGTGRGAALSIESFGKTGTSQDNRDALFLGFADDLVVGVWVGNDDNSPNPGLSGGGIPARIWRDFMQSALGVGIARVTTDDAAPETLQLPDAIGDIVENGAFGIDGTISGFGLNLSLGRDGAIEVDRNLPREDRRPLPGPEPADRPSVQPRSDRQLQGG